MIDMKGKNVLVISPHPDDAESGAGGTISKWSSLGANIVLVVCTNGNKGTSDRTISSEALAQTRKTEQLEAAKILGLKDVKFLDYPDQELEDSVAFRKDIVKQIRIHQPDIILTIDPERKWIRHRDHYFTGRVALDAIFPYARDYLAFPDLIDIGLQPHKTLEILLWATDDPDVFIDIDDSFNKKVEALYCHASQMSTSLDEGKKRLTERFSEFGFKVNAKLAEPFKRITTRP
jgi:LmbE family N-acetylglucosaminyl deacetylase